MCGNNCGGFGGNCSWILIIWLYMKRSGLPALPDAPYVQPPPLFDNSLTTVSYDGMNCAGWNYRRRVAVSFNPGY